MRIAPLNIDPAPQNIQSQQASEPIAPSTRLKPLLKKVLVFFIYVIYVVVSYLATRSNKQIKSQFDIYVTPSSLFFKIWPVIYSLLTVVTAYSLKNDLWSDRTKLYFTLSNLTMLLWLAVWSARNKVSLTFNFLILICATSLTIIFCKSLRPYSQIQNAPNRVQNNQTTLNTLNTTNNTSQVRITAAPTASQNQIQVKKSYSFREQLIVRNSVSLYCGWLLACLAVNLGLVEVYLLGVSKLVQFVLFWTTTPIIACAVFLFMINFQKSQIKYSLCYCVSILWGVVGASIASITRLHQLIPTVNIDK